VTLFSHAQTRFPDSGNRPLGNRCPEPWEPPAPKSALSLLAGLSAVPGTVGNRWPMTDGNQGGLLKGTPWYPVMPPVARAGGVR